MKMNTIDSRRTTPCAILLLLALFSSLIVQVPRVLATGSIFVTPSAIDDQSILPGSTFRINSSASNVVDVFTWQVQIEFDPSVLRCLSASVPLTSIFKMDFTPEADIDNVVGTVALGSSKFTGPGVSGSGVLATLNFSVIRRGYSRLNYSRPLGNGTYLLDSLQRDIPLSIQDSYFDNHIPGLQNWLTVLCSGSGTTNPAPGVHLYDAEVNVTVDAIPYPGYKLDRWELDSFDMGCQDPYLVTMLADHVLKAVFSRIRFNLTLEVQGSGTTDPVSGNYTYDERTLIEVHAFASLGWVFDHWEYDILNAGSQNPFVGIMDRNHVLEAVFTKIPCTQYSLQIEVSGSGSTNPAVGNFTYDEGSRVSVEATGAPNWVFDHWLIDGLDVVYFNPYELVMNNNYSLLAVFVAVSSTPDNAILNLVSKTVVGWECSLNVTFTVQNQGSFTATWRSRVNITMFWNGTATSFSDGSECIELELGRGETVTRTVVFMINASETVFGKYVLSACLSSVPFETDLADNSVEYGFVWVAVTGDVVGCSFSSVTPNGVVDMRDIGAVAAVFGATFSSSDWSPNMDIDNDGCVTQLDIGIACQNFGRTTQE
jgi:hypothetical protein